MKLKYDCEVYGKDGSKFATLAKGVVIKVLEVTKKGVKIQWQINEEKPKFGYVSHKQFTICIDEEEDLNCEDCSIFGNCYVSKDPKRGACQEFSRKEG